eukprot:TRINITY_DN91191_c0_g1_i1.p1 TRINITY_DN91191_c0_g1~~TRINITY_DN91191_c0_g1_i1.p1  ORF type:complete len:248 (-),score=25.78 TRINITY_DN91191_c0_g1_i1:26-712(-)
MPSLTSVRNFLASAASSVASAPMNSMPEMPKVKVELVKPAGGSAGFTVMPHSNKLIIAEICDGSAAEVWNSEHPDAKLQPGLQILSVNGLSNTPLMLQELRGASLLSMQVSASSRDHLLPVLTPGYVAQIPSRPAGICNTSECAICFQDDLPLDEPLVQLPCRHAFHRDCVQRWLCSHKRKCPTCSYLIDPSVDPSTWHAEPTEEEVVRIARICGTNVKRCVSEIVSL